LLAAGLALVAFRRTLIWQKLVLAAVAATALALLLLMPFTWAGGGGPVGNRYFLSSYPALLFVIPLASRAWTAPAAWGGMAFVASMLVNPFVTAKQRWQHAEHGLFRLLPVEMTMLNDLPILLDPSRGRRSNPPDPRLMLYFLDDNAWLEPGRIWIRG